MLVRIDPSDMKKIISWLASEGAEVRITSKPIKKDGVEAYVAWIPSYHGWDYDPEKEERC